MSLKKSLKRKKAVQANKQKNKKFKRLRVVDFSKEQIGSCTPRQQSDISFSNLFALLSTNSIVFPPELQRRFCWNDDSIRDYFESSAIQFNFSPIILIDIRESMNYCEEKGDTISAEWFREYLEQGYKYIGFDGQNRIKSIQRVFDNKVTLSGKFRDKDDKEQIIENQFFRDMPIRLKDALRDIKASVIIVNQITQKEVSIQFKRLQGGYALNSQECRNSTYSPVAHMIRDLSEDHKETLKRLVQENKAIRMLDDELVAKSILAVYDSKSNLDDSHLDKFYSNGEDFYTFQDENIPYDMKKLQHAEKVFEFSMRIIKAQKYFPSSKLVPSRAFWSIILVADHLLSSNSSLYLCPTKDADFFESIYKLDRELIRDGETQYHKEREKQFNKGNHDWNQSKDYYNKWCDLPHQSKYRLLRQKALMDKVNGDYGNYHLKYNPSKSAAA